MVFHDFHHFWRHFADLADLASPRHGLLGSLSMVVTRAYLANEARIGRKITGKSFSFDPVWVLWGLEQARDHSEPILCQNPDSKNLVFFKDFSESALYIKQPRVRSHFSHE